MIRLFFAGDFCCTPSPSPVIVDSSLQEIIQSCDVKYCNFETPLRHKSMKEQKTGLYQNDEAPSFLERQGFNLFSMANNHAFDYGEEGALKTIKAFKSQPIGIGNYNEAISVRRFDINGIKVGFLAATFAFGKGVFNDSWEKEGLGCAYINDPAINHVIIESKKELDYLIVLPHDGIEYIDVPIPETISRYRDFIDYGADAVIGAHPHCPQGWETYKGKPIFYSLGNFFFNSKEDYSYRAYNRPHWYEGLCVILILDGERISYETINTRNVDNLKIVLDNTSNRLSHNKDLCNYLQDKIAYGNYLTKALYNISLNQEISVLNTFFYHDSKKEIIKQIGKMLAKLFLFDKKRKLAGVYSLINNDSRRNMLIRFFKNIQ